MQLLNLSEAFHLVGISHGKLKQTSMTSSQCSLTLAESTDRTFDQQLLLRACKEMSGTDGNFLRLPLQSHLDLRLDITTHL